MSLPQFTDIISLSNVEISDIILETEKKLFDLQCLWRAEQIELESVEICFDFIIITNY